MQGTFLETDRVQNDTKNNKVKNKVSISQTDPAKTEASETITSKNEASQQIFIRNTC